MGCDKIKLVVSMLILLFPLSAQSDISLFFFLFKWMEAIYLGGQNLEVLNECSRSFKWIHYSSMAEIDLGY